MLFINYFIFKKYIYENNLIICILNMLKNLFSNEKEKNLEHKQDYKEILNAICIINFRFLAIGKMNGELSIYDFINKKDVYNQKIFKKSFTYLVKFEREKDDSNFIACSENCYIVFFKLEEFQKNGNYEYKVKPIKIFNDIHNSYINKLEYFGKNIFASCSNDKTFKIWNYITLKITLVIENNDGIENFFLEEPKENSFKRLIFLNKKGALYFYIFREKPIVRNIIFNIDYTNSKNMIKQGNKLFIGGYNNFQIISLKEMQIETIIKINKPVCSIFNLKNKSLILGNKNGELEFINIAKNMFHILEKKEINNLLNSIDFNFTNLFNSNNKIVLFDDLPIKSFLIEYGKIFCISDEIFKVFDYGNKQSWISKILPWNYL